MKKLLVLILLMVSSAHGQTVYNLLGFSTSPTPQYPVVVQNWPTAIPTSTYTTTQTGTPTGSATPTNTNTPVYAVHVDNIPTAVPQFTQLPYSTLPPTPQIPVSVVLWPTPVPQNTQIPMATPNATVLANASFQLTMIADLNSIATPIAQATPNATVLANASNQLTQTAQNNLMLTPFPTQTGRNIIMDVAGNAVTTADDGNGGKALEISIAGHVYQYDANNSTTSQLAAGATFTGAYTTILNQPCFSIQMTSDQNGTLILSQYIDSVGTYLSGAATFSITAGQGFNQARVVNGNYFRLKFVNNGASTTTTLNINTYYGDITPTTQLNNQPMALNEINGTALSLGQALMTGSIPVALASNQSAVTVVPGAATTLASSSVTVLPGSAPLTMVPGGAQTVTGGASPLLVYDSALSILMNSANALSQAVTTLLNNSNNKTVTINTGQTAFVATPIITGGVTVWGGGPVTTAINNVVTLGAGSAIVGGNYLYYTSANKSVSATGMAVSCLGAYPMKTLSMAVTSIGGSGAVTMALYAWSNPTYAGGVSVAAITITGASASGQTFISNPFPALQYGVSVLGIAASTTITAFVQGAQF